MIHMGSMSHFLLQNWYTNSYVKKQNKTKQNISYVNNIITLIFFNVD